MEASLKTLVGKKTAAVWKVLHWDPNPACIHLQPNSSEPDWYWPKLNPRHGAGFLLDANAMHWPRLPFPTPSGHWATTCNKKHTQTQTSELNLNLLYEFENNQTQTQPKAQSCLQQTGQKPDTLSGAVRVRVGGRSLAKGNQMGK